MTGQQSRKFTIIAEFEGETSVTQVRAGSADNAFRAWARENSHLRRHANKGAFDLKDFIRDAGRVIPVNRCQNVWCISGLVSGHLLLVHIILTVASRERAITTS